MEPEVCDVMGTVDVFVGVIFVCVTLVAGVLGRDSGGGEGGRVIGGRDSICCRVTDFEVGGSVIF